MVYDNICLAAKKSGLSINFIEIEAGLQPETGALLSLPFFKLKAGNGSIRSRER